jgi:hypothetical protein
MLMARIFADAQIEDVGLSHFPGQTFENEFSALRNAKAQPQFTPLS